MAAARSPALESAPAVITTAPSPKGPGCSTGGLHPEQEPPYCPVFSRLPPVPGGVPDPGLLPLVPWDLGPVLLESRSWAMQPPRSGAAA